MFRRSLSILGWILLGAMAAGGSVGYFLYQANVDRRDLSEQGEKMQAQAAQALHDTQTVAQEANQKLAAAGDEVVQAQAMLQASEDERARYRRAQTLPALDPFLLHSWKEQVSVPLGVSIRVPIGSTVAQNGQALACLHDADPNDLSASSSWLLIQRYDPAVEQAWQGRLFQPQPVIYFTQGRLLVGERGVLDDTGSIGFVFHVEQDATSTHLIWARTEPYANEQKILTILSGISFGT